MNRGREGGEVRILGNGVWMTLSRWCLVASAFLGTGWKLNGMWRDVMEEIRGLRKDLGTITDKFSTDIHRLDQRVGRIETIERSK